MRILIPVDGSSFSEQAIAYATMLSHECATCIKLARVHEILPDLLAAPVSPASANLVAQVDDDLRASEVGYLRGLAASLTNGSAVETVSLAGSVADALAEFARQEPVDLVVMTTHGRGGLSRAWMGSVADRLVRLSDIPVVLLRPSSSGRPMEFRVPRHILVPLDGSTASQSILDATLGIDALAGAHYTLMQVLPQPIVASREVTRESAAALDAACERSSNYLESVASSLRSRGVIANTRVMVQDNVAAAVIEEALHADCDMIAMATHGRSGWARLTLGSVTDKVMRSSPRPLLVVRSRQEMETLKSA